MYAGKYDWNANFAKDNQQKYGLCNKHGYNDLFHETKEEDWL